jgi:hypothetical protein
MVDLCFEAGGLLFAKFQLQLHDLLLLPEPSNDRPEFGELAIRGIAVSFSWGRRRGVRSITNFGSLRANRLKVVVKKRVLRDEVLATNGRIRRSEGTRSQTAYRTLSSVTSLSRAFFC